MSQERSAKCGQKVNYSSETLILMLCSSTSSKWRYYHTSYYLDLLSALTLSEKKKKKKTENKKQSLNFNPMEQKYDCKYVCMGHYSWEVDELNKHMWRTNIPSLNEFLLEEQQLF